MRVPEAPVVEGGECARCIKERFAEAHDEAVRAVARRVKERERLRDAPLATEGEVRERHAPPPPGPATHEELVFAASELERLRDLADSRRHLFRARLVHVVEPQHEIRERVPFNEVGHLLVGIDQNDRVPLLRFAFEEQARRGVPADSDLRVLWFHAHSVLV